MPQLFLVAPEKKTPATELLAICRTSMSTVNLQQSTPVGNPFNPNAGSKPRSGSSQAGFEEQLSVALSESLSRLDVAEGEVNISIRNSGASSARQILITWNNEGAAPEAALVGPKPEAPVAQLEAAPRQSSAATASRTPWSIWNGPRDSRDEIPGGGNLTTESGAPKIELNAVAAKNQYNYSGPAAFNPYFTTPSNPLRAGYVTGFQNWFQEPLILGGDRGPTPANKQMFSTAEGAEEALRLIQQYEPEATVVERPWGGGMFTSNIPMYYISVPGGRQLNAGSVLYNYYHGGYGAATSSDTDLERAIRFSRVDQVS